MAMSGLGYRKDFVGIGKAISAIFKLAY